MSASEKRPWEVVYPIAEQLLERLAPTCEQIEIKGSLARRKAMVGDIELVAIPTAITSKDLFGNVVASGDLLQDLLAGLLEQGAISKGRLWGGKIRQFSFTSGKGKSFDVDIFICTRENWGNIATIRTGSANFSAYLMSHLKAHGMTHDGGRLWRNGHVVDCPTEQSFFDAILHPWVEPHLRSDGLWEQEVKAEFW